MLHIPAYLEKVYRKRRQANAERKNNWHHEWEEKYPDLLDLRSNYTRAGLELVMAKLEKDDETILLANQRLQDSEVALLRRYKELEATLLADDNMYHCVQCHDTGNHAGELCSCALEIVKELEYKSGVAFAPPTGIYLSDFDVELFTDEISEEWYGGRASPREVALNLRHKAEKLVVNFPVEEQGIYFFGKPGTGKTWLAAAIANSLREKGFTTAFIRTMDFVDLSSRWRVLERSFYADEVEQNLARDKMRFLENADILVLDDIGAEATSETSYNDLIRLIEQRLNRKKTMSILTGNLSPEDISRRYDERLGSRLIGNFTLFPLEGPDIRLRKARNR